MKTSVRFAAQMWEKADLRFRGFGKLLGGLCGILRAWSEPAPAASCWPRQLKLFVGESVLFARVAVKRFSFNYVLPFHISDEAR